MRSCETIGSGLIRGRSHRLVADDNSILAIPTTSREDGATGRTRHRETEWLPVVVVRAIGSMLEVRTVGVNCIRKIRIMVD